jgi:SAM-dependent methyltransferase
MNFFYRLTRKAHHLTGKLHDWAKDYFYPAPTPGQYVAEGCIPWSSAYNAARFSFAEQQLASEEALSRFREGGTGFLPAGYGYALDERCIEWPWALAHIGDAKRILDAGSALNHAHLLALPVWEGRELDIYTLAPEGHCEWFRGISYLFGDLRHLPYRDQKFDCIISISTLEHVGMDNSTFSGRETHKEHATSDVVLVLAEFRRILNPGWSLLFTVPYGKYEDHVAFQQFDADLLERCAHAFNPVERRDDFFLYTEQGWQAVEQSACAQAEYAINATQRLEPDHAAAARAVACCQWRA